MSNHVMDVAPSGPFDDANIAFGLMMIVMIIVFVVTGLVDLTRSARGDRIGRIKYVFLISAVAILSVFTILTVDVQPTDYAGWNRPPYWNCGDVLTPTIVEAYTTAPMWRMTPEQAAIIQENCDWQHTRAMIGAGVVLLVAALIVAGIIRSHRRLPPRQSEPEPPYGNEEAPEPAGPGLVALLVGGLLILLFLGYKGVL